MRTPASVAVAVLLGAIVVPGALRAGVPAAAASAAGHRARGAAGPASAAGDIRAAAGLDEAAVRQVTDALYTLGCTDEADRVGNAADATHQIQTCRVTTKDPADRPVFATNPAPADWAPEVESIRKAASSLERWRWPPALARTARALGKASSLLAEELSWSTPGGARSGSVPGRWSTSVLRQMGRVEQLAGAAVTEAGSAPRGSLHGLHAG